MTTMNTVKEFYNKYKWAIVGVTVLAVVGTAYMTYGWSRTFLDQDSEPKAAADWKSDIHVPSLKVAAANKAVEDLGEFNVDTLNATLKTKIVQHNVDFGNYKEKKAAYDKTSWYNFATPPVEPEFKLGNEFVKLGFKEEVVTKADFAFTHERVIESVKAAAEAKVDTTAAYNNEYNTYKEQMAANGAANAASYMPLVAEGATATAGGALALFGMTACCGKKAEDDKPVDQKPAYKRPADRRQNTDPNARTRYDTAGDRTNTKTDGSKTQVEGGDDTKTNKAEKKSGMPGWAIFLIIFAIVAVIGAVVYFVFFTSKDEDEEFDEEL